MDDGATRSRVIRSSLRAFTAGLFSLVPLLGLPAGILGLAYWVRAVRRGRRTWNPASNYLNLGAILAVIGIAISIAAMALLLHRILNPEVDPGYDTDGFNTGFFND